MAQIAMAFFMYIVYINVFTTFMNFKRTKSLPSVIDDVGDYLKLIHL